MAYWIQEGQGTVIGMRGERTSGIQHNVSGHALSILAAAALLMVLYFGRIVFITAIIAVIIALILEPFVSLLVRLRVPRAFSTLVVCLIAILFLYFGSLAAWNQLSGLADDVPAFRDHLSAFVTSVSDRIQRVEDSARHFVVPERKPDSTPAAVPAPRPASKRGKREPPAPAPAVPGVIPEVRIHDDSTPIAGYVYARLGTFYEFILMASFVPFLVYFMLSWRDHIYQSFLRFFEGADRLAASRSLEGVAEMARAFAVGNFLIGILLAAVSWGAFAVVHVPYPFLVGVLSGFLSLVPYLGMPIALVPPVVAVLASGEGGSVIFLSVLIVLTLHLIAMNVLYPKLVGARVHLNPLIVTFSLMFWGFLWGAPGLILAIPITAGMKAVFDNVEGLRPYGRFLGD